MTARIRASGLQWLAGSQCVEPGFDLVPVAFIAERVTQGALKNVPEAKQEVLMFEADHLTNAVGA